MTNDRRVWIYTYTNNAARLTPRQRRRVLKHQRREERRLLTEARR